MKAYALLYLSTEFLCVGRVSKPDSLRVETCLRHPSTQAGWNLNLQLMSKVISFGLWTNPAPLTGYTDGTTQTRTGFQPFPVHWQAASGNNVGV